MFGSLEILYLFLGGTGAGLSFVASTLGLLSPASAISMPANGSRGGRTRRVLSMPLAYRRLIGPVLVVSVALLVLGALSLLLSLGKPDCAFLLFVSSRMTWGNVGAFSLLCCIVLSSLHAAAVAGFVPCSMRVFRILEALSLVVALLVALYTGLLLYDMDGSPFWHSPFLPVLFTLSSLSCGMGALALVSIAFRSIDQFKALFPSVMRVDFFVILSETVVLLLFLLVRFDTSEGHIAIMSSLEALCAGWLSFAFWGLFVGLGIALPLVLEFATGFLGMGRVENVIAILSGAILVGGATLRYCVVCAAVHPFLGAALAF